MNYSNNLYKRYITQLFSNNPKKTISISRTTQNILLDKMSLNSNTKFFIKNKNKKNLFVSQQSQRIIKNLSIDSFAETKKIRLNKTIEIKNLKINKDKKFPKITQYERNLNNFDNNNIPKLLSKSKTTKREKSIENISKSPMYYYRLLQIYKIKEILDYKKKKNEEFLKQLVVKNSVKKNKFILNRKEKGKKIGKIKLINIRIKNEEKDSEEDIDKVEQNFYNLIKKGNERIQVSNFDDDNKIMNVNNFNNFLNKKNLAQREKNYSENSKIFNYKNILFHNPILINNLNI